METPQQPPAQNPPPHFEILKLLYERAGQNWLHYDSHVWQIPSLAIALNTFLIGQIFNPDILAVKNTLPLDFLKISLETAGIVRGLLALLAGLLTFVLLVALVKHRLHQRAQDQHFKTLEQLFGQVLKEYDFSKKKDLYEVEKHPFFIERWLAPRKTNKWLMGVMLFAIGIDLILFVGIVFRLW